MYKVYNYYLLCISLAIAILLKSCANIKPPTGGPEDTKSPELLTSTPANNSLNYHGNTVVLEFDEFVDAQKVRDNLIISPIFDNKFSVITRKKIVILKFDKEFEPNTTYSFMFGESVKDVTRGNVSKNLLLAFSTGPYIDSLSISGKTENFLSGKPMKEISIELYNAADTLTIKNSRPVYFSKTNSSGDFNVNNMKAGTYHVYALNDVNKNYLYDNEKELIGFLKNIRVDSSITIKLELTRADTKSPKIVSRKQEEEGISFNLSEGAKIVKLEKSSAPIVYSISENRKKITTYPLKTETDSVSLYFSLEDSVGNKGLDSLKLLYQDSKAKTKKEKLSAKVIPKNYQLQKKEKITINFSKPIHLTKELITIKVDTVETKELNESIHLDSNFHQLTIHNKLTFKDSLIVKLKKGCCVSFGLDTLVNTVYKFKNINEEEYGMLSGKIICEKENYIFQLVNQEDKIVYEEKNAKDFKFTLLEPGSYKLRIIVDTNNNGYWNPTNYENNTPPEQILYYKEVINLRANWEVLDIVFDTTNTK